MVRCNNLPRIDRVWPALGRPARHAASYQGGGIFRRRTVEGCIRGVFPPSGGIIRHQQPRNPDTVQGDHGLA